MVTKPVILVALQLSFYTCISKIKNRQVYILNKRDLGTVRLEKKKENVVQRQDGTMICTLRIWMGPKKPQGKRGT
jgi:hypothetical protein